MKSKDKKFRKNDIDKIIKYEQNFINELIKINKQPIISLVDAHKRIWINTFIAQSYYSMAVLENMKKETKYEVIVSYKNYIIRFLKKKNLAFAVPKSAICFIGGEYNSKSTPLKNRIKWAIEEIKEMIDK